MKNIAHRPKIERVYEYADADGNRGMWVTYITCPNCDYELEGEELGGACPDCGQLLDWDDEEKPDFD